MISMYSQIVRLASDAHAGRLSGPLRATSVSIDRA